MGHAVYAVAWTGGYSDKTLGVNTHTIQKSLPENSVTYITERIIETI